MMDDDDGWMMRVGCLPVVVVARSREESYVGKQASK